MRVILIVIIVNTVTLSFGLSQSCRSELNQCEEIFRVSSYVSTLESISIGKRIRQSKKLAKQALELAYKTIENNDCNEYSQFVNLIIQLELNLGNKKAAEKIALERLNKIKNWKDLSQKINTSNIYALYTIHQSTKEKNYYERLRNPDNHVVVTCGWFPYSYLVAEIRKTADVLFHQYGKSYCLKYLQENVIAINEDDKDAIDDWHHIYKLLLQSMSEYYSFEQIKLMYEQANIEDREPNQKEYWEFGFNTSNYRFKFGNIHVYLNQELCDKNNLGLFIDRCAPTNIKEKKHAAILYKMIHDYADLEK